MLAGLAALLPSLVATAQTSSTITGRAYNDISVDGAYTAGTDPGMEGVTIDVYDARGTKVGAATSDADGLYSVTLDPAPSGTVRVEFSTPTDFRTTFAQPGVADDRSSIRFVAPDATNVDYGVFDPTTYCQYSIASVCLHAGITSLEPGNTAIALSPFSPPTTLKEGRPVADNQTGAYVTPIATKAEVGATWGLGFQQKWGLLWNSAVIRRHAGLGPKGLGGLYVYDLEGNAIASFDLTTDLSTDLVLTDDMTKWTDASRDIRATTDAVDGYPARGLLWQSRDIPGFSGVGKAGVGDIDVSVDGNFLWVSNLHGRTIHRIAIAGSADEPTLGAVQTWALDDGHSCAGTTGPFRAWALDPQPDGKIVVAGQCTNESAPIAKTSVPGAGVILQLDPAANGAAAWATESTFAFHSVHRYEECAINAVSSVGPGCTWKAWSDDGLQMKSLGAVDGSPNKVYWTQPMVVNVEKLPDGSFALGVSDRSSYQWGQSNYLPEANAQNESMRTAWVAGDTLLVCKTESGWERESKTTPGSCGSNYQTGRYESSLEDTSDEVLYDNYGGSHLETTIGGLAYANGQLAVAAMDPADFNVGGIRWISTTPGTTNPAGDTRTDGNQTNALNIAPKRVSGSDAAFGKSAGMGDLEAICDGSPLQIGNRVWFDDDKNGIQDPDEAPVVGVTVRLYDSSDTLVGTAVTDASGEYYFTSSNTEPANGGATPDAFGGGLVADAEFTIKMDNAADCGSSGPLFGWKLTDQDSLSDNSDNDDLIDSDAAAVGSGFCDEGVPTVDVDPLPGGTVDHSFDIGFFIEQVGFGDYVWIDSNADGVQDADEEPLKDVVVNVLDDNGDPVLDDNGDPITATTDENGYYFIDGLSAGDYQAEFVLPEGYGFTLTEGGASDEDSNPYRATSVTPTFSITPDDNDTVVDEDDDTLASFVNLTIDAGVVPLVGMGDYTWIDSDEDGLQDDDEEPLAGVDVTLFESDGTTPAATAAGEPATATTDEQGYYFIDGLNFGDYQVQFDLPAGYGFTGDGGGVAEDDSNADPDTGRTPTFTITPFVDADADTVVEDDDLTLASFVNPTIDAGVVPLVGMGDYTWIDYDSDGVQDGDEPALEGVTVTLYDVDGTTPADDAAGDSATDTTAADGSYFIDGLLPGTYTALFELPDGYVFTTDEGTPSDDDSNPDPETGLTPEFDITPRVEGDTEVEDEETTLASFLNPTIDGGVVPLVAISNYFWFDEDGDGLRDAGEEPYVGGTVRLLLPNEDPATDAYGDPVPDATTNDSGFFLFDDLLPGTYRLLFLPPEGYTFTTVGTTDADDDSNAARDGLTDEFTVNSRPLGATIDDEDPTTDALLVDPTVGAGLVPRVAVGDYTWEDVDLQGDQAGEPLLPGVTVELLDDNGDPALDADGEPVPSTVTNDDGIYTFDNLVPGDYSVKFTAPEGYILTTQGTGGGDDSNPVTATGITPVFTVEPTETGDTRAVTGDDAVSVALLIDPTIDAGFIRLVGMGDYTWVDYDRDGRQDDDEPPLAGVRVRLYLPDGVTPATDAFGAPATARTDSQGYYFIDALVPGDYRAKFTLPSGYIFTRDLRGDGETDSNPLPSTGITPVFSIDSEEVGDSVADTDPDTLAAFVNPTIDAGVVALVAMGNYTWIDADQDGKQDETERPLAGVRVTLYRIDGTPATDVIGAPATDVTDSNGYYFIDGLLPGVYYADFQLPAGYVFTIPRSVSSPADSNPAPTDNITLGRTPTFTLTQFAGSDMMVDTDPATWARFVDPTIDAGVVPLVAMGDYTWIDSDRDGIQDADEETLAGVTVTLVETDGTTIVNDVDGTPATTVTDDEGLYFIDALLPGTYRTQFELPAGYVFTTDDGSSAADDSNPVPTTGLTPSFTIEPQVKGDTESDVDLATRALLVNPTIDAGVVSVVAVGDYTWIDRNRDGLQNLDERPLAGVIVTLLEPDGSTPATDLAGHEVTATTNDVGYYFFDGLAPGEYRVKFELPDGFVFTDDDGDDSKFDSNADPLSGVTPVFEVFDRAVGNTVIDTDPDTLAGFVNPTIDAGVVRRDPRDGLVAVGDYVWIDSDGDGVQDAGEPPLRGATVLLYSAEGGAPAIDVDGDAATAVTDSQGRYLIDALLPGEYEAEFRLPSGYALTRARTGGGQADSNPTPGNVTGVGRTPAFTLAAEVGGQMVADTDPDTRAVVADPTIDAGAVTATGQQGGGGSSSGGGSSGGRPLPSTGLMWGLALAWVGALLLLAGAGLITLARRRRVV